MTYVWGILSGVGFFVLVLASIALHEVGHMVPAKLFGVKVPRYFVGFGPTLWSRRRGETEYGVKAIPLGGYVQLLGMYPPGRPGRTGRLAQWADAARDAEREDITETDVRTRRLLYQKKTWQKVVVMAGGPLMNVLLAFLIFQGLNLTAGQVQQTLTVDTVVSCIDPAPATCVAPPAKQAGIQPGDTIVAVNGQSQRTWSDLVTFVRNEGEGMLTFTVQRPGQGIVTLPTVQGVVRPRPDLSDPSKTVTVGYAGMASRTTTVKVGPVGTVQQMWSMSVTTAKVVPKIPVYAVTTVQALFSGQARDINGPISIVGAAEVAGQVASSGELDLAQKVATWYSLLAGLNLAVAIFNLVPLPPLDGGHIAGALWEALRRGAARLLRRPDPGYADTARLVPVAYVVGAFLAVVGVVFIVADIVSPIRIF